MVVVVVVVNSNLIEFVMVEVAFLVPVSYLKVVYFFGDRYDADVLDHSLLYLLSSVSSLD